MGRSKETLCHRSSLELCHYLDTGIVWLKLPKAHPSPSNLKRSSITLCRKRFSCVWCIPQPPQVVETSCPIKGVMCTRKGIMQQISCYTAHSCAYGIYWLSSAFSRPKSLLSQYISCGTRACVTTMHVSQL